jgi:hypothetical protein
MRKLLPFSVVCARARNGHSFPDNIRYVVIQPARTPRILICRVGKKSTRKPLLVLQYQDDDDLGDDPLLDDFRDLRRRIFRWRGRVNLPACTISSDDKHDTLNRIGPQSCGMIIPLQCWASTIDHSCKCRLVSRSSSRLHAAFFGGRQIL